MNADSERDLWPAVAPIGPPNWSTCAPAGGGAELVVSRPLRSSRRRGLLRPHACLGRAESVLSLVGADTVIAVDHSEERLALSRTLGATHILRGDDPDLAGHVRAITGGGVKHAFEAIGSADTIELLPQLIGRGDQAVVGMPPEGVRVVFDPFDLADGGKRILGCNYGSSVPSVDFPRLARLHTSGRLSLDRLVGQTIALDAVDEALEDLGRAVGLRTVVTQTTSYPVGQL